MSKPRLCPASPPSSLTLIGALAIRTGKSMLEIARTPVFRPKYAL